MIPEVVVDEPPKEVRMQCMDAYRYTAAKCSYKVCIIMFLPLIQKPSTVVSCSYEQYHNIATLLIQHLQHIESGK